MKAVGYLQSLPIEHAEALDIELPNPTPGPHDLLVKVHAVSVNPVDTKVRKRSLSGGKLQGSGVGCLRHGRLGWREGHPIQTR